METKRIRVLVADDHPLVRVGLRNALEAFGDIEITAEAADGTEAVSMAAESSFDVALIDLSMPGADGWNVIAKLSPSLPCVALTSSADGAELARALDAGALSVLRKTVDAVAIADAVRAAAAGQSFWDRSTADLVLKSRRAPPPPPDPFFRLTAREREVLELIGKGSTNDEIADALFVSRKTVKVHVGSILAKTGEADRTKLAVLYWKTRRG